MSNFAFIKAEWPELHDAATKAEGLSLSRCAGSMLLHPPHAGAGRAWLYQHDRALTLPYQDHLSALIHEPSFRQALGPAVFYQGEAPQGPGQSGRA